jgi:hypothetical protein
VAQVSILRPGCSGRIICEEKPRSQNRDLGHPLNIWRVQLVIVPSLTGLASQTLAYWIRLKNTMLLEG